MLKPSVACTPRLGFWIVAGLTWIIWMFAVSAASDDQWLEFESDNSLHDYGDSFAAGSDTWLDLCDDYSDYIEDYSYYFDDPDSMEDDFDTVCELCESLRSLRVMLFMVFD